VRRALAVILFLFEPFLAAGLLLRVGPTLFDRDALTGVAFAARVVLALSSVAAAIGLRDSRPYADRLALIVLISSGAFAVFQYFTRALPTSLAPDVAALATAAIVIHHGTWVVALGIVDRKTGD
jgi:hypothetical protein